MMSVYVFGLLPINDAQNILGHGGCLTHRRAGIRTRCLGIGNFSTSIDIGTLVISYLERRLNLDVSV